MAGDLITYENDRVSVNGQALPYSAVHSTTRDGLPLVHVQYPVRVGKGEVWLASVHADGYDSRYYGPVAITALSCVAEPIWTR